MGEDELEKLNVLPKNLNLEEGRHRYTLISCDYILLVSLHTRLDFKYCSRQKKGMYS